MDLVRVSKLDLCRDLLVHFLFQVLVFDRQALETSRLYGYGLLLLDVKPVLLVDLAPAVDRRDYG